MNDQNEKPWFKQAWPWFVFSIPLLTIVAGVLTYQIAADKPHSMVQDDYFKKGLAINQSLAKQKNAEVLKLEAVIKVDDASELLIIRFANEKIAANQLLLSFSHPTQEKYDQFLQADKLTDNEFITQIPSLPQAHWHIRLTDKEENWLLKSRWHYPHENQLAISFNR